MPVPAVGGEGHTYACAPGALLSTSPQLHLSPPSTCPPLPSRFCPLLPALAVDGEGHLRTYTPGAPLLQRDVVHRPQLCYGSGLDLPTRVVHNHSSATHLVECAHQQGPGTCRLPLLAGLQGVVI